MANPTKRTTRSKRNMRRSHHALKEKQIVGCTKCKQPVLPHHACKTCGTYKNKRVEAIKLI